LACFPQVAARRAVGQHKALLFELEGTMEGLDPDAIFAVKAQEVLLFPPLDEALLCFLQQRVLDLRQCLPLEGLHRPFDLLEGLATALKLVGSVVYKQQLIYGQRATAPRRDTIVERFHALHAELHQRPPHDPFGLVCLSTPSIDEGRFTLAPST
jgi:hypothetical protein